VLEGLLSNVSESTEGMRGKYRRYFDGWPLNFFANQARLYRELEQVALININRLIA
jgi:hypothetical protein